MGAKISQLVASKPMIIGGAHIYMDFPSVELRTDDGCNLRCDGDWKCQREPEIVDSASSMKWELVKGATETITITGAENSRYDLQCSPTYRSSAAVAAAMTADVLIKDTVYNRPWLPNRLKWRKTRRKEFAFAQKIVLSMWKLVSPRFPTDMQANWQPWWEGKRRTNQRWDSCTVNT